MTREEAIYLLNNLRSVAEGKEDEALDMAIEALSADAVSREDTVTLNSPISIQADMVLVVRCKDCRWFKQDSSPVGYGYCDGRMVGREVDYNDYCSYGERREP